MQLQQYIRKQTNNINCFAIALACVYNGEMRSMDHLLESEM